MKARIIYNPVAGQRDMHREIRQVTTFLRQAGWETQALETHAAGDAQQHALEAAKQGCELLLSAGGDGTLNEVVNGLAGSNTIVGVLPIGTGNVWAKEIGVPVAGPLHPVTLVDAARTLLSGLVYKIDTARANQRRFLLWAGIGFDAQIVSEVENQYDLKRKWGALPFVMAGAALAVDYASTQATIMIDNTTYTPQKVVLILASNIQSYGAGLLRPANNATLDDGYLDIYIFMDDGPLSPIHHTLGMLTHMHITDPRVSYHRARYLRIDTSSPVPVHLDGAPTGQTPLEINIDPKSLRVLVPHNVRKSLFGPDAQGLPLAAESPPKKHATE